MKKVLHSYFVLNDGYNWAACITALIERSNDRQYYQFASLNEDSVEQVMIID